MRDHEEAAGIAGEVILKPNESFEIEVIGRLIEDEEGGLRYEESREVSAHDPAAGKRFGGESHFRILETEAGEDFARARFDRPIDVPVLIVVVDHVEFRPVSRDPENGFVADRSAFLRKKTEVRAAFPFNRAGIGCLFAENEVKESRFTRTIGADKAVTIRPRDKQRHPTKQLAGAVRLGNVGDRQHKGSANRRVGARVNASAEILSDEGALLSADLSLRGRSRFAGRTRQSTNRQVRPPRNEWMATSRHSSP